MKNQPQGAAVYSPTVLAIYDFWVLRISNTFAWGCSTSKVLLPFFKRFVSANHLDVGAGTGFYPRNAMSSGSLTLLDSNPACLEYAKKRCEKFSATTICHDVTWPFRNERKFDSISIFYLLHCLPRELHQKEAAITNLKENLTDEGVLFGATILGDSAGHNWFGALLMAIYNRDGIFENRNDSAGALSVMLSRHFRTVSITTTGRVALFTAIGKKVDHE